MDLEKLKRQGKRKIWRIVIGDRKGKLVGYKLVDAKSAKDAANPKYVGERRTIIGVLQTNLKGTTAQRSKLPRSKRFGRGFERYEPILKKVM